jgi:hypothetical protein
MTDSRCLDENMKKTKDGYEVVQDQHGRYAVRSKENGAILSYPDGDLSFQKSLCEKWNKEIGLVWKPVND